MTKNFPKLMLDTSPQMQEAYRTSSKTNAKKLHLGISHSSIKDKEKTLKEDRGGKIALQKQRYELHPTSPQKKMNTSEK